MRKTKAEAQKTRAAVLTAAAQIIGRQGMGGFTLDAVAHEAGVTKGGVLHHFPSKEELIDGVIAQVMELFLARLTTELAAEPAGLPGRWLRAYIRTIFAVPHEDIDLIPALAAAVTADAATLAHIRAGFAASQQAAADDGLDPAQATLIRLAVDGYIFARALNVDVLDRADSQRVAAALTQLTRGVG